MTRYVLDSNIYIEASRNRRKAAGLVEFTMAKLPQILLHAVVVQEILAGAVSETARRNAYRDLVEPFERRGRLLAPSYTAWRRSGEIIAALIARGELSVGGIPRSFANDTLIAASCREAGVTLITENVRDFKRIQIVERIEFAEPWPAS